MRPPPVGGGYDVGLHVAAGIRIASMRPPPVGGGYKLIHRGNVNITDSFNEAAARGRRIPPGRRCPGRRRSGSFNEAAARGRRILAVDTVSKDRAPIASMRPPPVGGGYADCSRR